jgi:hypothetical protein
MFGASALASYRPTEYLSIVADFSASIPVWRDRFQFEPVVFHRVDAVVFSAGMGAGVRF